MSLVGLAVVSSYQGKNIGKELIKAFEKEARALSFRSLRLSVYAENAAARRVYEKCGWSILSSDVKHGKAMSYYRIL